MILDSSAHHHKMILYHTDLVRSQLNTDLKLCWKHQLPAKSPNFHRDEPIQFWETERQDTGSKLSLVNNNKLIFQKL